MNHAGKILVLILALPAGVTACKGKPASGAAQRAPGATATAAAGAEEATRRAEVTRRVRETLQEIVFFDFDRSDIRPEARRVLDSKVTLLRNDLSIRLRIEGHADERGTDEYNMALSRRRAESVRRYLIGRGVDASRLEVTSLGERRPLASGSNEQAWARNRRSEFVLLNNTR